MTNCVDNINKDFPIDEKIYDNITVRLATKEIQIYSIECSDCGIKWEAPNFTLMIGDVQRHQWEDCSNK